MMQRITDRFGKWSAFPLGIMFAVAFCPTTAATLLAMLALTADRMTTAGTITPLLVLPAIFGLGTSLPILLFAGILSVQRRLLDQSFQKIMGIERPARWFTGSLFILAGLWLTLWRMIG
jgi:cytochrome c biogenesis protein CcdA